MVTLTFSTYMGNLAFISAIGAFIGAFITHKIYQRIIKKRYMGG